MVRRNNNEHIWQKPDYTNRFLTGIKRLNGGSSGFTIIELLTIVTIIGILASIAFMAYVKQIERAKRISAVSEINTIVKDIRIEQVDGTPLPVYFGDVGDVFINYAGFNDPWGQPYQYAAPPVRTKNFPPIGTINTEFDVYSMGPDGNSVPDIDAAVSLDDIIRAGDDHYIGKASGYQP